ncbi:MAG: hypothetical protein DMF07_09375 [Verrucomicrobia bacterium]|nr:MAG: hypothetical protein DMF07_09375 [Verrucomicrobiota bacterium]
MPNYSAFWKRNDRACDSFKFKERCQFFVGGDDETLSSRCGSAIQTVLPWGPRLLEQPEEFEDDHDNDNHSNYVKDVSAHAGDSYQIARAMVNIYPN